MLSHRSAAFSALVVVGKTNNPCSFALCRRDDAEGRGGRGCRRRAVGAPKGPAQQLERLLHVWGRPRWRSGHPVKSLTALSGKGLSKHLTVRTNHLR